jgi:hypothetical protein
MYSDYDTYLKLYALRHYIMKNAPSYKCSNLTHPLIIFSFVAHIYSKCIRIVIHVFCAGWDPMTLLVVVVVII